MTDEKTIEFHKSINNYEWLVYLSMEHLKHKGEKLTMEAIHAQSIGFLLASRIRINEGSNIIKTLPKLATFDKTTQKWSLKSIETILQETKSKRKVCKTPTKEIQNPKNLAQKHS